MALALVTGSSTGIGLATSISLARAGHTVVAAMRNLERSGEIRRIAEQEKLPIHLAKIDVDDDESVREGFAKVVAEHGPIDILVNNAGIPGGGVVEETTLDTVSSGDGDEFLWRSSLHQSRHPEHARAPSRDDRQRHLGRRPHRRAQATAATRRRNGRLKR